VGTIPELPPQPTRDPWGAPQAPPPPAPPAGAGWRSRGPLLATIGVLIVGLAFGGYLLTRSGIEDDGAPGPGGTPAAGLAAPTEIRAKARSFQVTLSWRPGRSDPAPVKYLVRRDGAPYAEVEAARFVDDAVLPADRYEYEVLAVAADGATSEPATVTVRTLTAPPATARLSGDYLVNWEETNHFGFSTFGRERFRLTWFLTPNCAKGPCTTTMSGDDRLETKVVLQLAGGSYAGSAQAPFLARCGSDRSGGSVTIRLRPTAATADDGTWRVSRFEGTVTERIPAQSGCVSSGSDWRIGGRFVG
jgi:hypothetical protein